MGAIDPGYSWVVHLAHCLIDDGYRSYLNGCYNPAIARGLTGTIENVIAVIVETIPTVELQLPLIGDSDTTVDHLSPGG